MDGSEHAVISRRPEGDREIGEHSRHHYVPQFYLRQFLRSDSGGEVSLFHIPSGRYVPRASVKMQAQRTRLYGPDREKAFSRLESMWSPLVREMAERDQLPKQGTQEHLALVTFVLFQHFRTPAAAAEHEFAQRGLTAQVISLDSTLSSQLSERDIVIADPLGQALSTAGVSVPLLLDLRYKILTTRAEKPFLLSDHPIVFYNQFLGQRRPNGGHTGLQSRGLQIFVPLSPTKCLLMFDEPIYKVGGRRLSSVRAPATDDDIDTINCLQAINAQSQLFFSDLMTEETVRSIIRRAGPWRAGKGPKVSVYEGKPRPDGQRSTVLKIQRNNPLPGAVLSIARSTPFADRFVLGPEAILVRDKTLCVMHREFRQAVKRGTHAPTEFFRFVQDRNHAEAVKHLARES